MNTSKRSRASDEEWRVAWNEVIDLVLAGADHDPIGGELTDPNLKRLSSVLGEDAFNFSRSWAFLSVTEHPDIPTWGEPTYKDRNLAWKDSIRMGESDIQELRNMSREEVEAWVYRRPWQ